MKRGWLLNGVLLTLVAALATFIALKPGNDAPGSYRISTLTPANVQHIRVERARDPAIVIERREGVWRLTAPFSARADTFQVERLLAVLDAVAAHRMPAQDLARFELDPPATRLIIDGVQLGYGAVNAVTREQYVLAGDSVYAIAARYGATIPGHAAQLVNKRLLDEGEVPVRYELPNFSVSQDGKGWAVSPAPAGLSQDEIHRWLEGWRHAAALRAEAYSGGTVTQSIKLQLRNGRTLTLEVLQKTPEFVIARPDEKLRYHFSAQLAKRLLEPPAAQP